MDSLEQDYCENEVIEEDEVMVTRSKLPFSSTQSPSSSSSSSARSANFMLQKQDPWLPSSADHSLTAQNQHPSLNSTLEFTDLSLGNEIAANEKEHLFDKVVTPSDVGKLNRLVIPKQHAERYFPLNPNSNEKGLILSFEDRNGKQWRFRYSYWNSSQSYVMTKGWSRFVKDKKLTAGDIVSFQRGVGESTRHQLYIDYRRRPRAPDPTSFAQFGLQNQFWLYSLPSPFSRPPLCDQRSQFRHLNHDYSVQPYHHRCCNFLPQRNDFAVAVSEQYFLRPQAAGFGGLQGDRAPVVIDSVPVVRGRSAGKRLRLFGVNMESSTSGQDDQYQSSSATAEADSNKGKSSLSFDLDLS